MEKTATEHLDGIRKIGFTLIKNAIPTPIVDDLLKFATNFSYTSEEEKEILKSQQRLNGYGRTVYNLPIKRPDVLKYFIRGMPGEILRGLLNDKYYTTIPSDLPNFILRNVLLRSSLGAMPYHIDSMIPYQGNNATIVQSVLFLNDSKRDNGCTLLVPKSHLTGEYAPQGENPDAVALEAEPGDIAIWDSRIWHATLENTANRDRWALVATFVRWYMKQGFDYPRMLPKQVFDSLDVDEKIVYGYCSYTPKNEFERTELKSGIADIKRPKD